MEPTVYISPTPWYKRKLVWGFLLVLILIPVGFYVFKIYFLKTPQIKSGLDEEELPVALEILQNPMVYEWRGAVSGTLVAKDNESITISNDKGQTIKISVDLNPNYTGTKFYKNKPSKDPRSNFISLDDIPLGARLSGDFFVFPRQKNQLMGSSFIVSEQ